MIPSAQPVLLVEDSPEDREATVRALKKAGLVNPIFHCGDGDGALDFLHHRGPYVDQALAPRPGIILLDLNLPGTDGRDVLAEVKSTDHLRTIPVLVLTTSADERDIQTCYHAGANGYVTKPVDLEDFMLAMQRLKEYWFDTAILPRAE